MGDFHPDSNFRRNLRRILDDVDLSIDERLEQLVALLNESEPALLEASAKLTDEEIAKAFLEFVLPTDPRQEGREDRFIAALVGAGRVETARPPSRLGRAAVRAPDQWQA